MLYKTEEKFMKIGIIGNDDRELFKSLQAHVEGLTVSGLDYEVLVIDSLGSRTMLNSEYQAWLAQGSERQGQPVSAIVTAPYPNGWPASAIDLMHPPVTRLISTPEHPDDWTQGTNQLSEGQRIHRDQMKDFLASGKSAEVFFCEEWEGLQGHRQTNLHEVPPGLDIEQGGYQAQFAERSKRLHQNSVYGARTPASKSRLMGLQLLAPTGPQDPHGYRPKPGKGQRKANRANRWG